MERMITPLTWGIYNLIDGGILSSIFQNNPLPEEGTNAIVIAAFAFCIIISYLLGSINCALVVSRFFFHEDVREKGSGNAGATNVLRNYGKKAGALTLIGDGLKGVISILIACAVFGAPENTPLLSGMLSTLQVHACYLAAFFCILGHVFPCFSKFRGGKGVATLALSVLFLNPAIFAILMAIFVALVAMTKYVSLGSVVCAMFYPIILHSFDSMMFDEKTSSTLYGVGIWAIAIGLLVLWAHRGNLKRIMDRTERKLSFSKKNKETVSENEPEAEEIPDNIDLKEPAEADNKKKHPVSKKKLKRQKGNK